MYFSKKIAKNYFGLIDFHRRSPVKNGKLFSRKFAKNEVHNSRESPKLCNAAAASVLLLKPSHDHELPAHSCSLNYIFSLSQLCVLG